MSKISFTEKAWEEYCYWQVQDKKTIKKINILLKDIQRNSYSGIGKPEPLKEDLSGLWSRRIDEEIQIMVKDAKEDIEKELVDMFKKAGFKVK